MIVGFAIGCVVLAAFVAWRWRERHAGIAAAFVIAALLACNGRWIGSTDSAAMRMLPFMVLRDHSLTFDSVIPPTIDTKTLPYWFVVSGGHVLSRFPVATALLATPFYAPAVLSGAPMTVENLEALERIAAASLTALMALLVWRVLRQKLAWRPALFVLFAFVFATPVVNVLGKSLWQHTGGALAAAFALYGLFSPQRSALQRALIVGVGAGVMVACRPFNALLALPILLTLFWRDKRTAVIAGFVSAIPVAAHLGYQWHFFGSPMASGYGDEATNGWTGHWFEGLAGILVSPARGMLLYAPIAVVGVAGLFISDRDTTAQRQFRTLGVAVVVLYLVLAKWWGWWGGLTPGPRMLTDALPLVGLGLARLVAEQRVNRRLLIATGVWGLAVQALISYVPDPPLTDRMFYHMVDGPWNPLSFAPLAYLFGFGAEWAQ